MVRASAFCAEGPGFESQCHLLNGIAKDTLDLCDFLGRLKDKGNLIKGYMKRGTC